MSEADLRYCIAHFERLTRRMLKDRPSIAEIILNYNEDRSIRDLTIKDG